MAKSLILRVYDVLMNDSYSGFRPGRVALAMVVLGMAMVGITIVFGG